MESSDTSASRALLPVTKRPRVHFEVSDAGDDHENERHRQHQTGKAFEEVKSEFPLGASKALGTEERVTLIYSTMIKMHRDDMTYKDEQLRERDRDIDTLQSKLVSAEGRAKLGNWKLSRAETEGGRLRGEVDTLKSQLLLANEKTAMLEQKLKGSLEGGMEVGAGPGEVSSKKSSSISNSNPPPSDESARDWDPMAVDAENRGSDAGDKVPISSKGELKVIPCFVRIDPLPKSFLGTGLTCGNSGVATTVSKSATLASPIKVEKPDHEVREETSISRMVLRPRPIPKLSLEKKTKYGTGSQ